MGGERGGEGKGTAGEDRNEVGKREEKAEGKKEEWREERKGRKETEEKCSSCAVKNIPKL